MASLAGAARVSEQLLQSPTKHDFMGKILPPDEGRFELNYGPEEMFLRVRPDCPVITGDEMLDPVGRRYLLLDYDHTEIARTHRLVLLNEIMNWSRLSNSVDPVTRAKKDGVPESLGEIWVGLQVLRGDTADSAINVKQDMRRAITRAPLQLGDKLNKFTVQRVTKTLGVFIAEVQ